MDRRRQHTGDAGDGAVEAEFAQRREARQLVRRQYAHGAEHGERDRQIEMAAFLQDVGRRQVDDDALGRQPQADGAERAAHALAAFADGLVWQADDDDADGARQDLHLHVDLQHLDALEGHRLDPRDHGFVRRRSYNRGDCRQIGRSGAISLRRRRSLQLRKCG